MSEETIAGNLATVEAHFHSETATMLEKMLILHPGEAPIYLIEGTLPPCWGNRVDGGYRP